jgi:XisH protein
MPAKNIYHDAVRDALTADGWTITHDPLFISFGRDRLYVDLAADRPTLGAERNGELIAVEIQSFLSRSSIADLQQAVGQYVIYRLVLEETHPGRTLFLAVSQEVYADLTATRLGETVFRRLAIRSAVCDMTQRRIVEWTS